MIVGENKLTVYNKAAANKYPISYFQSNLAVYYAIK
jgi:hypothetical protein